MEKPKSGFCSSKATANRIAEKKTVRRDKAYISRSGHTKQSEDGITMHCLHRAEMNLTPEVIFSLHKRRGMKNGTLLIIYDVKQDGKAKYSNAGLKSNSAE